MNITRLGFSASCMPYKEKSSNCLEAWTLVNEVLALGISVAYHLGSLPAIWAEVILFSLLGFDVLLAVYGLWDDVRGGAEDGEEDNDDDDDDDDDDSASDEDGVEEEYDEEEDEYDDDDDDDDDEVAFVGKWFVRHPRQIDEDMLINESFALPWQPGAARGAADGDGEGVPEGGGGGVSYMSIEEAMLIQEKQKL